MNFDFDLSSVQARWEAVLNTSTVTLRVVEGDEKVSLSLRSQISDLRQLNMVMSLKWLGPEKGYAGENQQHIQKTDSSSR
jgi:hypothetical protein